MHFASPTWAKSLTQFNPHVQDFKRVLDLILSKVKGRFTNLIVSIGFQFLEI